MTIDIVVLKLYVNLIQNRYSFRNKYVKIVHRPYRCSNLSIEIRRMVNNESYQTPKNSSQHKFRGLSTYSFAELLGRG